MESENRKTITLLDLAKETGYSRNTVAKALNGKHVSDKTKKNVFDAAIRLGYKSYNVLSSANDDGQEKRVLILSTRFLLQQSFFINFIRGTEDVFRMNNVELLQYSLSDTKQLKGLASYLERFHVDGILCVEVLTEKMVELILSLNKPTVFLDFICNPPNTNRNFDIILPDSFAPMRDACSKLIETKGLKTFGFIGDYRHCLGFYNRFAGMREALFWNGLPYDEKYSILKDDSLPYSDVSKLKPLLKKMSPLPDCFVCANDYIAIGLILALKQLKVKIPQDVCVLGFDNVAEAKMNIPSISSIQFDKVHLGAQAAKILLSRMKYPNTKNRILTTTSKYIFRDSTS